MVVLQQAPGSPAMVAREARTVRVRSPWSRTRDHFGRAPASLVFVFTLVVTWWSLQGTDHRTLHRLVVSASTNLHNMTHDPVQVLVVSAFWVDGASFPWLTVVEFLVVMVAAERWLGSGRWILVFVAGHVGATVVTVVGIAWALDHDLLPAKLAGTVDVGASYGFWAVAALLAFRFARPASRWCAAAVLVAVFAAVAWRGQTFTDYGHLTAVLIGIGLHRLCPCPDDSSTGDRSRAVAGYPTSESVEAWSRSSLLSWVGSSDWRRGRCWAGSSPIRRSGRSPRRPSGSRSR
ncbi:rhomboid-like protein [Rhodococcus sp. NPDC127528]|uniref:rhomboid-like protein n=1 Tax=unclassified Rhodococcus (in: high G+C Gram-positive bacteria) TaxID=192944 RepID=UPI00363F19AC